MRHNIAVKKAILSFFRYEESDSLMKPFVEDETDEEDTPLFFHHGTKFRAGILSIMLSNKDLTDTAGICKPYSFSTPSSPLPHTSYLILYFDSTHFSDIFVYYLLVRYDN